MDDSPIKPPTLNRQLANLLKEVFSTSKWDDSVEATAERVLKYWYSFADKEDYGPDFSATTFEAECDGIISVVDIEFSSICSHHLLPFYGKAHVAYIPNRIQIGLSKIPRLVEYYAQRLQNQERLTQQIADWLKKELEAHGVMVIIQARHTCMACRGVRSHNASMQTSVAKGIFLTAGHAKSEFLQMIGKEI